MQDATFVADLLSLVEPAACGEPMSPLRWTCKSLSHLTGTLVAKSQRVGRMLVGAWRCQQRFRLQADRKTREGDGHPDRTAPFNPLNESVWTALAAHEPVIPVDAKEKELVGDVKAAGREWRPRGEPEEGRVDDFLIKALGWAVPHGVHDLAANAAGLSLGMSRDTSAFAVRTIRRWWQGLGQARHPRATRLTLAADGGGSNGARKRPGEREPRRLADEPGIDIVVHHLPPGTSQWNAVEPRRFSFISMNGRARRRVSHRVIVDLISATTTETGRTVRREPDGNPCPKGRVVSDRGRADINLTRDAFHGEWNYTIHPSTAVGQSA